MLLAELSQMRMLPGKSTLILRGETSEQTYFLKTGRIKISRVGHDGQVLTLDVLGPGEVFGELLAGAEDRCETVASTFEPSLLCMMERRAFEEFLVSRPNLTLKVAKLMGFRLKRIESRLQDLLFLDVKGRVMKVLSDLSQEHGLAVPSGVRLGLKLTHEDIAQLCGTRRETVTLALGELRDAGQIAFEGRYIVLRLIGGAS